MYDTQMYAPVGHELTLKLCQKGTLSTLFYLSLKLSVMFIEVQVKKFTCYVIHTHIHSNPCI